MDNLQNERDELQQKHDEDISDLNDSWTSRLKEVEERTKQQLEEAQRMYTENLSKTAAEIAIERDNLLRELGAAKENLKKAEVRVRQLEAEKSDLEETIASGPGHELTPWQKFQMVERAAQKQVEALQAENKRCKDLLQEAEMKAVGTREETSQELRMLRGENVKLNELVLSLGRALIAEAAGHASSALGNLENSFCRAGLKK
eukprot:TRINITY_DN26078_c0_g2_i1.p1 TRINITY_DN26078_c0_g2~~TRINITY_DN26078_c0_g2_i1.p1  ORF type:complete len:203 (-),score=38.21 TRINITY_DN26078_c0_g2_i1:147-755(-)